MVILGTRAALASAVMGVLLSANAIAGSGGAGSGAVAPVQTATPDAQADDQASATQTLSTIVVTGSRARAVTEEQSLTPIDVISQQTLTSTGATNLIDALQRVLPSLSTTFSPTQDTSAFQQQVELRGLAPDEVLVLVNGKRWHPGALLSVASTPGQGSQGVDLRTIPIAAIDHIEVLRDSASAQYGSDAIAGVVNIILKSGPRGGDVNVTSGKYAAGDGQSWQGAGDIGFPLAGDRGWMRVAVDYAVQDPTNRAGIDRRVPEIGKTWQLGVLYSHNANMMLNTQYDLTPNVHFYAFGHFSKFFANPPGFYRYGLDTPFPNNPLIGEVYPNGFLPHEHGISLDRSLVLGLKGDRGYFHWDLSVNHGDDRVIYSTVNTVNYAFLNDFGNKQSDFYDGLLKAGENTANLDMTYSLGQNWDLAFGGQWLRDSYKVTPGELGSYYVGTSGVSGGAQGFAGWGPADAISSARRAFSQYVQLQGNFTDKLSTSLAVRHEHYSDFGSNISYGASLRYDFTPQFALRGSASTGFRAPSLTQEHYTQTSLSFLGQGNSLGLPQGIYLTGLVPTTNPIAKLLGATPLKPEKSRSYTIGAVWNPTRDLGFTTDIYRLRVHDIISQSSTINVTNPAVLAYLGANGVANPEFRGVSYFTNAGDIRVLGIDVTGNYTYRFAGGGVLTSTLGASYHKNTVFNVGANPAVLDQFGGLGFQRLSRTQIKGILADTMPRMKLVVGSTYTAGPWSFAATATRYGRITTYAANPSGTGDLTLNARWHVDASISYLYAKRWTFTLGGDNIFNRYPQRLDQTEDLNGVFPFQSNSPGGYQGAYVYARAGYRW